MRFQIEPNQKETGIVTLCKNVWHTILDVVLGIVAVVLTIVVPYLSWLWWGLYASFLSIDIPTSSLNAHLQSVSQGRDVRKQTQEAAMLGRMSSPTDLADNGQLMNSRQANDPLRVAYGIVRTGGVWVYQKVSRLNNQLLNVIITWGEGEIDGIATGVDPTPIYTGSGLNDLLPGGTFKYAGCSCDMACYSYVPCTCDATCYGYY